jgi:hypothetical protein
MGVSLPCSRHEAAMRLKKPSHFYGCVAALLPSRSFVTLLKKVT